MKVTYSTQFDIGTEIWFEKDGKPEKVIVESITLLLYEKGIAEFYRLSNYTNLDEVDIQRMSNHYIGKFFLSKEDLINHYVNLWNEQ